MKAIGVDDNKITKISHWHCTMLTMLVFELDDKPDIFECGTCKVIPILALQEISPDLS